MDQKNESEKKFLKKPLSRREFLILTSAASAGGLLAACMKTPTTATSSPTQVPYVTTTPIVGAARPAPAGSLIFLSAEAWTAFDPYNHGSNATFHTQWNCYDVLLDFTPQGDFIPRLATAYKVIPEGLELTLRQGVKFHEGQPFTAADVKASVERFTDKQWAMGAFYPELISVNVIDDYTVQLLTGYPLSVLNTLPQSPIVCKDDVNNIDKLNVIQNGTGPFKWNRLEGETLYYDAFIDHWQGPPLLKELVLSYVNDPNTRLAALQRGEAHVIERVPGEQLPTIASDPNLRTEKVNTAESIYLAFKATTTYMKNKALRDAIAYCVDQQGIVDHIMSGNASMPIGYLPRVVWPFNVESSEMPRYDLEKAKQKLIEAGYPGGEGLPELLTVATTGLYPNMKEYTEYIAASCAQVGINLKVEIREVAAWYDAMVTPDSCDLGIHGFSGGIDPDFCTRTLWFGPGFTTGYSDPALDGLINEAAGAKDVDERANFYRGGINQAIAEANTLHPIQESMLISAMSNKVKNWVSTPFMTWYLWNVALEA
jgi:peptide/nickel transport system substrate-binding protein